MNAKGSIFLINELFLFDFKVSCTGMEVETIKMRGAINL